jgi:acetyltransferase-like isoleucine patch superfamily enzyme
MADRPELSSSARDVVLFGIGHVAEVITVYLERFSDLNIVGYTVDADYLPEGGSFNGKPIVAWEEIEMHFPCDQVRLMGPLTYQRLNQVRRDRYLEGKARGYRFASFIHPASHILTDQIGEHVIILEQNVIQPFASIGDNIIIWSGNHIGHHVSIGNHCFLASMVGIAGNTQIGEQCYLGGQVGINHGLKIGDRCAVLNAILIDRDLPDDIALIGRWKDAKSLPSMRIRHLL